MQNNYDVIIVGGGIIGARIFHRLSCINNSLRILLVEKNRFGCGSTGYSGGMIRLFHPDKVISDLAYESYKYYKNFKNHTKIEAKYIKCGFLYLVSQDNKALVNKFKNYESEVNLKWIDAKCKQFPCITWAKLSGAIYDPEAGYMDPKLITRIWIELARDKGNEALEGMEFDKLIEKG